MSADASATQYVTPTPMHCIACVPGPTPTPGPPLPFTGLDVGPLIAIGLVVVTLGVAGKAWLRSRF